MKLSAMMTGAILCIALKCPGNPGDDMVVNRFDGSSISWSNCIVGTPCSIEVSHSLSLPVWTNLVSGIVATSSQMSAPLSAPMDLNSFHRVSRPLDLSLGLVAWYRFENDTIDSSAFANNGTNNGVVFAPGRNGTCAFFDGGGASIRVPQSSSLKITSAMTICAWIAPLATDGLRCIVDKDYALVGYNLYVLDSGIHMRICDSSLTAGSVSRTNWTHVAGVYTGSRIRIFINGNQAGETSSGALADRTDKDVYIGMWGPPGGPSRYYSGYMDDVRIYNRPLTPQELQALARGAE